MVPAGQIFIERKVDDALVRRHSRQRDRNLAGGQLGPAHVDPHAAHFAAGCSAASIGARRIGVDFQIERQDARAGFDLQRGFLARP